MSLDELSKKLTAAGFSAVHMSPPYTVAAKYWPSALEARDQDSNGRDEPEAPGKKRLRL
jgi:hypothetical protein